MNKFFVLFVLPILLVSCVSTRSVDLKVTLPPEVGVPSVIQKIAVLSRTQRNSQLDKMDQVLSLESESLEKEGEKILLSGFENEILASKRFEKVAILDSTKLLVAGNALLPTPLAWDKVDSICKKNDVDILFVLEGYDTDTHVDINTGVGMVYTRRGSRPVLYTDANMNTAIQSAWRVYDPVAKYIVDEYQFTQNYNYNTNGINPLSAFVGVLTRNAAVKDLSKKAGVSYANRYLPHDIMVTRSYFVRGTDNFKTAKKLLEDDKWIEAISFWQKETTNADIEIAGRACFNMAVASEINGKISAAVDWAIQADNKLKTRKSQQYVNILRERKDDEQKLLDLKLK